MSFVNPVFLRLLVRGLKARGIPEQRLLRGVFDDTEEFWNAQRISVEDTNRVLRHAMRLAPQAPLPFLAGAEAPILGLGRLGFAMFNAPRIEQGLMVLCAYTRTEAAHVEMSLEKRGDRVRFRAVYDGDLGELLPLHAVPGLLVCQSYCEQVSGAALPAATFRFSFPRPGDTSHYDRHFHGRCEWGSSYPEIVFDAEVLECRSPYSNAVMWKRSLEFLDDSVRELGATRAKLYSEYVQDSMRSAGLPLPSLEDVASELNISPRTLSRRLQKEGSSYRDVREQLQNRLMREYLAETNLSIEAISMSFGYQDVSSFRRAFLRANNVTPGKYRASHRSEPSATQPTF